jgi:hypothetical protein
MEEMMEFYTELRNYFHNIVSELTSDKEYEDMPEVQRWLERALEYNVPHGKFIRLADTAN